MPHFGNREFEFLEDYYYFIKGGFELPVAQWYVVCEYDVASDSAEYH